MGWYRVERKTKGREIYLVQAGSAEAAESDNVWIYGELLVSEVTESEPYSVVLEREED